MTSPNVQIQNLIRRYVREKDGNISMNMVIDRLLTPPTPTSHIGQPATTASQPDLCKLNLAIPFMLQTAYLTNFKASFEYSLNNSDTSSVSLSNNNAEVAVETEDIFEMDEQQNTFAKSTRSPIRLTNHHASEIAQYMGQDGILANIYGAELVNAKWLLYGFIISKIHRTFKRNILTDHIHLASLHLGDDNGSVPAVLNHLFTSSEVFQSMPVKWNWVSTDYTSELYYQYKSNFIPILRGKPIWEQIVLIINKTAEIADRYNLVIYQIDVMENMRNQYLIAVIMALRFTDQHSVFLLEIAQESEWGILEINIVALCGMIFDMVYLTKYDIDKSYCVLVCSDKKKNIGTNMLLKKLIKVLTESDTHCILAKNIFPQDWLEHVMRLRYYPVESIPFMHIINSINGILKLNNCGLLHN